MFYALLKVDSGNLSNFTEINATQCLFTGSRQKGNVKTFESLCFHLATHVL